MGGADHRRPKVRVVEGGDPLHLGRKAHDRLAWEDAHRQLLRADEAGPLGAEDLERLAAAAYLTGRDEDYLRALERAHHARLDDGEALRAARLAFWLGLRLAFRGEGGPAGGWFGRAQRLIEREGRPCVEEGYLLLPSVERLLGSGDLDGALAAASRAAEMGDRFREADLGACARHLEGRVLIRQGRVEEGLALLDEAMVAVTAGELSPIMTGLVYCSVVEACQQAYALDRAREWTSALATWCAKQPQLVSFTGTCLVHRAEVMLLSGAWDDALEEARSACERLARANNRKDSALAFYQQAEVHRLRGAFAEAEQAYRSASEWGCEPQPGMALLRMAQGRADAAAAAIRRAVGTTEDRLRRTRLLPAHVEIMLAAGDAEEALEASRELEEIATRLGAQVLRAMAGHARGAVALAGGDAQAALLSLRTALDAWHEAGVPYEVARVRVLMGLACRVLGDEDGATLELEGARAAFERLGAVSDLARLDALAPETRPARPYGLTPRELQVLRMISAGKPNKAIAAELCLSERTIDRHVSNILGKLDVHSRTAAAAWAYEHGLV